MMQASSKGITYWKYVTKYVILEKKEKGKQKRQRAKPGYVFNQLDIFN